MTPSETGNTTNVDVEKISRITLVISEGLQLTTESSRKWADEILNFVKEEYPKEEVQDVTIRDSWIVVTISNGAIVQFGSMPNIAMWAKRPLEA